MYKNEIDGENKRVREIFIYIQKDRERERQRERQRETERETEE